MDKKEIIYIDTLIINTLWYEFSDDFDVQRDFGKFFVTKKLLLSYILNLSVLYQKAENATLHAPMLFPFCLASAS